MSFLGPREPVIIPIPTLHLTNIDTLDANRPSTLRLQFTEAGFGYFRNSIYPYILQGYQVKIKAVGTRGVPTTALQVLQTSISDFFVTGNDVNGTGGAFSMHILHGGTNQQINHLIKFTGSGNVPAVLYTENGIDYSHYSYVIYP